MSTLFCKAKVGKGNTKFSSLQREISGEKVIPCIALIIESIHCFRSAGTALGNSDIMFTVRGKIILFFTILVLRTYIRSVKHRW